MVEKSIPAITFAGVYKMDFIKYEEGEKSTEYVIQVTATMKSLDGPKYEQFQIKDRYSGLLDF